MTRSVDTATRLEQGPTFHGDRCVHGFAPAATCRACIEACPRDAWILDESALSLDLDSCDGCGLCQAACPEAAIEIDAKPSLRQDLEEVVAFASCEKAGIPAQDGVLPCLHALGLREILLIHREGITHLVLAKGDCSTCARGQAPRLESTVERLNVALEERGLPAIRLEHCAADDWKDRRASLDAVSKSPVLDRRGLFRRLTQAAAQAEGPRQDQRAPTAPGALLPRKQRTDSLPYLPIILAERCVGCDACLRICPHGALRLDESEDEPCYRLLGERCTGCGLCVDVCEQDAVRIDLWASESLPTVPLKAARCRACGAPFHRPSIQARRAELCRICETSSHHRKLFQVLD
ncbi:MAG: 4Fe-4S binding protein [Kiloniellales bacterium]|nr:4Fe-4S binding protein [Kiloniellales bacterium]